MNRTDIIREIAGSSADKKEAGRIVRRTFEIISDALRGGEKVSISGFGSFKVASKDSARRRNPKTGEEVLVGPRRKIRFKIAKDFFGR